MNEENEKAIVELLSEMLHEQRITNQQLGSIGERVSSLESKIGKLEEQQAKTNQGIGELRLSVMRLADQFELVFQHEHGIMALEKVVFKG